MSLFGSSIKYSQKEHQFPEMEMRIFLAHLRASSSGSFTSQEEETVYKAVSARRLGDGRISLQQIYEVLSKLRNQNKITKYDYESLMDDFSHYYSQHFHE